MASLSEPASSPATVSESQDTFSRPFMLLLRGELSIALPDALPLMP